MAEQLDIGSLLEEGRKKYGGESETIQTPDVKTQDPVDIQSLLSEGQSKFGAPNLSEPEGTISQMGKQLVAGATTDLPKMVGEAAQAFTPEDWAVSKWGKEVAESAKAREQESQPDLRDKNIFQKALITGARAIAPSVAAGAGYAINPIAGTVGTIGLFGGSQGQETYEKMLENGASESDATKAALASGAIQGVGESIANRLTAGLAGLGSKAAVQGVKGLIGRETNQEVLKPFAKSVGQALVGEPATEIAQDIGTQAVEEHYGIKPEQTYGETAAQSGIAALGMTALLAPFGLAGHFHNAKIAEHIDQQLSNPEADPDARRAAVARLKSLADKEKIEGAEQWKAAADYAIANKLPVPRSLEEAQAITAPAEPIQPVEPASTVDEYAPEPSPIVEEPTAPAPVDESTLNRAKEFIGRWDNLQAEGRQPKSINENMLNAARSVGVENPEQITDPIEMLNAIRDSITVLEQPVPKTPGQTIVDDLESIKNKGPTVSAILNAKEAAAAAVDAQQAVNVPEQGEAPVIPEREQAVPGAEVVYQDLGDTGPEAYTQEWLAATDTKALETLLRTGTNKPGTGGLINDELKRRKELENAEQITETGEADGSRREQPEGSQENRDVTEPSAGVVPEGQADRNIPGIEEAQVEVQDGQSTNQAEKTATSEVAEDLERTSEGFQKYVPVKSNTLREAADFSEKSKAARAEEQTQEGDYQRGTVDIDGLTIAIENKKGTLRKGKDKDGNEWSQEMKSHYGEVFLRGEDGKPITGADGDLPDVFIAPGVTSLIDRPIFVIDQVDKDGNFDEHKVIMGPKNEKAAAKAYNDNYEKGWKGLGAITPMTLDEFKNWLQTEDVTKPVGNIEPAQPKKAPKKKYSPFVQEGDHLLEAIAKLGGLNRAEAKAQGIDPADFRKRGERIAYVFTSKGKSFDEMAELLRGYGFEYSGPNDLLRDVSDSLQTKRKIYSTKGAEIQAEELVDDYQLQFESDLAVLRDTAKRADELMPEEKWAEGTEAAISRGSVTPDTINEYIEEIDEAIAAKENPVEEELLQPQYVPPTPAKQPVAQQGDIFATTKKERDELAARQGVANFASAKDKKRNGNGEVEAEILTESGQEELPLVKSPEELPPDAVIRDIGAQKASGTTKLEAGGVLKVQNSGDLFNPNDPVIERFLDQADALPATKDSRSVTWTNAGNGFSARAYNSESMGPVLEIKSPSGAIVRKMKGRGAQDGEIVTDVEGTLDELFSGEAFNSFGEYFKNTPQLESGPMFSRPATRKQDDLAAIFSKLEYADAKADRDAILGDHPLKDQIDYIDQNFEKIFNALVKSDKNPEGKVERKCR